jgi:hypothetical protein
MQGVTLFFSLSIPAEGLVLVAVSDSYVSLTNSKFDNFLNFMGSCCTHSTQTEGVTLYSELPQLRAYSVVRNADLYLFCSVVLTSIIVWIALSQRSTK